MNCKVAVVKHYTADSNDFSIAELPRPVFEGSQRVEIEVHAASLNPIDYKRAEGMLQIMLPEPLPLRLGYDVAGVVTRVSDDVQRFKPGDRVYGRIHQRDSGAIGEYVVADESVLAQIPDSVEFAAAAAVPLAGLTAKQALETAGLQQGQSVFINGGMGGVGMFAIALAKHHFGAQQITATVSTGKMAIAQEMGATKVIDYTANDSYHKELENTADVAFDTVGDLSLYQITKPQTGIAVSVAMAISGDILEKFKDDSVPLSMFGSFKLAVAKRVVTAASWFLTRGFRQKEVKYSYILMHPDGQALESVFNPLLETGQLKPVLSNVYPFTDEGVKAAFKESRDGHATGKIVVEIKK